MFWFSHNYFKTSCDIHSRVRYCVYYQGLVKVKVSRRRPRCSDCKSCCPTLTVVPWPRVKLRMYLTKVSLILVSVQKNWRNWKQTYKRSEKQFYTDPLVPIYLCWPARSLTVVWYIYCQLIVWALIDTCNVQVGQVNL